MKNMLQGSAFVTIQSNQLPRLGVGEHHWCGQRKVVTSPQLL